MNTMMIMVEIGFGSQDDVEILLVYLTLLSFNYYYTSTQNKVLTKVIFEVYRAPVDELLQFHQLK
jgi:hypothetical protein